jgi:NAD+ synthase (glutamine-hydrolysing)
MVMSFLMA